MRAPRQRTPPHRSHQRTWLSPLTGIGFLVVGLTGVLMFFHLRLPGMTLLHELGGLLFVLVGAWHLKLNWRALLAYCGQGAGRVALLIGAVLTVLLLALGLAHDREHGQRGQHGSSGRGDTPRIVE